MRKQGKGLAAVFTAGMLAMSVSSLAMAADYGDVNPQDWYYDSVQYVSEKSIMTGYDNGNFGPADQLTRGQFATILYRVSGSPEIGYSQQYSDVSDGWFYSVPITWAKSVGVITGYDNGTFGPNDQITREQMATVLYRYEGAPEVDTGEINTFPDAGAVSDFARKGIAWSVHHSIITGDNGNINPQGSAVRAHCATILQRYLEKDASGGNQIENPQNPNGGQTENPQNPNGGQTGNQEENQPSQPSEPEQTENQGGNQPSRPTKPEQPDSQEGEWRTSDGGPLTDRNMKFMRELTYAMEAGGYPIVAPDEGINWERDVYRFYQWKSDTEGLGYLPTWEGDTEGKMPPKNHPAELTWLRKGSNMTFDEWFKKYFYQDWSVMLVDPYAEESLKKLGIEDMSGVPLNEEEIKNQKLDSGYPTVTESELLVPPVEGAVLLAPQKDGSWAPWDGKYIVSYDVYGGTGQWGSGTMGGELQWGIKNKK